MQCILGQRLEKRHWLELGHDNDARTAHESAEKYDDQAENVKLRYETDAKFKNQIII